MTVLVSLIVAIAGNVISYYIIKRLDGNKKW